MSSVETRIQAILASGESARDPEVKPVGLRELHATQILLGLHLPPSYCAFVKHGGLGELRIHHRVLNPQAMVENLCYVDASQYIPFADNECGDFYCWQRSDVQEPGVFFADHETGEYTPDAPSFCEWLAKNRF